MFKMFHDLSNISINDYLTTDLTIITRSNGFMIMGKLFRSNEVKQFFFNRVVNIWNYLSAQIVKSNTIETFNNRLDKYLASSI